MSNQGTIRLKVTNGAPAIEKLWNGRFKLEFFCDNNSPREDWYYENVSALLPEYGILQATNFGSGVSEDWEAIPDSVYPDMRLVLAEYPYNVRAGKHYVKLTYETLTASWVEEKDEDTDYELNGLKRVSRTFVALPGAVYDKVVGTSTIDSGGTTLYLGGFKIEKTEAKWSLSEAWLEAGELSREENSEDAKGSISITQVGGCPTAPAGYTVVNESKNNTQGFETCSRTFYKDDSELSRSNDYVGSQLAESIEVFSPTVAPTPTNGTAVLGNKSTSNVDGIPTTRYTFLVPSVLSESSDKVGSQLAITVEAFNEVPATPAGYSIASTQESDVEGIPTTRYTFLKPSVLSLSQEFVGGATTVQVGAFGMTEALVDAALSEVTASHILISQSEKDYNGIITSQFTYGVDDFEIESQAEDGMEIIVRTELSVTNFTSGVIGTSTYKALFLTQESIDNGNTIKKRTGRYSEAGVLSISPLEEDGFSLAPSYVYVTTGAPASSMTGLVKPNGTALGTNVTWFEPKVQNVEGFSTYTQQVLSIAPAATVKVHSVNKFFTITEPGVMSTGGAFNSASKSGAATRFPQATKQPRTYRKKATVDVYLTTSNLISESEVAFTELGVDWCSVGFDSFYTNETDSTASVSSSWRSFPQYLNSSGTTDTADASSLGVYYAEANSYGAGNETYTITGIYRVELEKYTRAADGTQLYLKTIVTF